MLFGCMVDYRWERWIDGEERTSGFWQTAFREGVEYQQPLLDEYQTRTMVEKVLNAKTSKAEAVSLRYYCARLQQVQQSSNNPKYCRSSTPNFLSSTSQLLLSHHLFKNSVTPNQ